MHLAACAQSRDNNFNLLRALAAYAVMVTHGAALASGDRSLEPLSKVAVDVFFAISGFLVTASLIHRGSIAEFARARFMRIYPALIVVILLSVFVAGPILTELSGGDYLKKTGTWLYLIKGLTLVAGVSHNLPGVFEHSHYPGAFNGSLWTLPIEVWLYLSLAVLWLVSRRIAPRSPHVFKFVLLGLALGLGAYIIAAQFELVPRHRGARLAFLFLTGASCYVFRERIRLSAALALGIVGTLAILAFTAPALFWPAYLVSVTYLVLCLAYLPGGALRRFNLIGDYSYGIYIYAFPIQQTTALFAPNLSTWELMAISSFFTILCAIASWHLVEKRARLRPTDASVPQTTACAHAA